MRNASLLSTLVLTLSACLVLAAPVWAAPSVGDAAPDFTLLGTDGQRYELSDHVGKREVVLAWFPKAFTPG